jgi:diguanylate cyclase (GGDEF)-like protein
MGMVTISAGVAAFPTCGLSVKDLLAAADAALYKAKKDGRDRVVVATLARIEAEAAAASSTSG